VGIVEAFCNRLHRGERWPLSVGGEAMLVGSKK